MNYILIFIGAIVLFAFVNYLIGLNVKEPEINMEPMESIVEDEEKEKAFRFITKKYKIHHSDKRFEYIYNNVDYNDEEKMKEFLIQQSYSSIYKTKKTKPKKETITKLTDDHKHWLGLVDMRVNSLPFDFYKRTYTVDRLGKEHFGEYKINEFKVPEEVREEVAMSRVEGLSSIRDYIKIKGSKEQKFHFESSIKGALLYASSLGINVDKYQK